MQLGVDEWGSSPGHQLGAVKIGAAAQLLWRYGDSCHCLCSLRLPQALGWLVLPGCIPVSLYQIITCAATLLAFTGLLRNIEWRWVKISLKVLGCKGFFIIKLSGLMQYVSVLWKIKIKSLLNQYLLWINRPNPKMCKLILFSKHPLLKRTWSPFWTQLH